MHHVAPQMCYYGRCAIWSASLVCTARTEGFWEWNIHLCSETWGRLCDINTADAALQFMSCTPVTRLSLRALHSAEALLFGCVSVHLNAMDQTAVHEVILLWLRAIWALKTLSTSYQRGELFKLLISRPPLPDRYTLDQMWWSFVPAPFHFFFLGFNWPYSCTTVCTGCLTTVGRVKPLMRIDYRNTCSHCAVIQGVKWWN